MKENKSFFNCNLALKSLEDENPDYFVFEGYASTYGNVDRGNDIVQKGAFSECIKQLFSKAIELKNTPYKKIMPILWQHDMAMPVGAFVEMRDDEKGLFVKGILPKDDDFVNKRVIPQMKVGSVGDLSIGYLVEKESYKDGVRIIEKAQLFETSLVTIPMNAEANITSFKTALPFQDLPIAPLDTAWSEEIASLNAKNLEEHLKKAFLKFIEPENEGDSGVYTHQIAGMVDGKLMAIPKAIYKAAFEISKEPELFEEKDNPIISSIEKYYEKMGLKSPFKKTISFRLDDFESLTERETESLLKSGVRFSTKNAKALISSLEKSQRDVDEVSQRDAALAKSLQDLSNQL